jgi:transcriptional regulator with XRE-family HTH domain
VLLQGHLARRGFSLRDYAQAVGVSNVYVNYVIYGERLVNLDKLADWMRPLGLTPRQAKEFETEAIISASHARAQVLIRSLLGKKWSKSHA